MTATSTLTPAEVLLATADFFEADPARWGIGWYFDKTTGCRCTLGAIAYVLRPDDEDCDPYFVTTPEARAAISLLERYLAEAIGYQRAWPADDPEVPQEDPQPYVGDWNDARGRTVHEVIGTLRAAARWSEQVAA